MGSGMRYVANWAAFDSGVCPPKIRPERPKTRPERPRSAPLGAYLALFCGLSTYGAAWAEGDEESMVEIGVTGARLSPANTSSPSPIVVLDNEELQHQGALRTEEFLNTLPQVN